VEGPKCIRCKEWTAMKRYCDPATCHRIVHNLCSACWYRRQIDLRYTYVSKCSEECFKAYLEALSPVLIGVQVEELGNFLIVAESSESVLCAMEFLYALS
jgi:hypothetical protein